MERKQIETMNDCGVAVSGDGIVLMMAPTRMPKDKALRMAAWIVALADDSEDHSDFHAILEAVEST